MLFKGYKIADLDRIASSFFLAMMKLINIDGERQSGGEAARLPLSLKSEIPSLRGVAEAIFHYKHQVKLQSGLKPIIRITY